MSAARSETARALDEKVGYHFAEVCISKGLVQQAGLGTRSIPAFVAEWLIDRSCPDGQLDDAARARIAAFIEKHLPTRDRKGEILHRLGNREDFTILDEYSVTVNLLTNTRRLRVPSLDLENAFIERRLVDEHSLLLAGGMWGAGRLTYRPPDEEGFGQVWMVDFRPMQYGPIDIDFFAAQRAAFSTSEWRALLIMSMVTNPSAMTHVLRPRSSPGSSHLCRDV
jgi:ATP-dependent Lon protease